MNETANVRRLPDRVFDWIIWKSLNTRRLVLLVAALFVVWGGAVTAGVNVDVFPDLNRPVVTLLVEAPGLASEEVETAVTIPIESALLGTPGVTGVRSSSRRGIATIRVEFTWDTEILRARQLVNERLDTARADVPDGVQPVLGPITSIMGEIMLIGITPADESDSSLSDVQGFAEWTLKRRLLAIPGVSNVTVLGGHARAYEVSVDSALLARRNISFQDVVDGLSQTGSNTGGGFFEADGRELAFRNVGAIFALEELSLAHVGYQAGIPLSARDIGRVREGWLPPRGAAGVNNEPGVIVAIQKQPGASTLELTDRIQARLETIKDEYASEYAIDDSLFLQSRFIERAIENVIEALRDGAIIVVILLFLFLWNARTTIITLAAIPLSLLTAIVVLYYAGFTINTLTLGGLAVAIGELVDDAVVDVENCFRRLRENRTKSNPLPALEVVYRASLEIRSSIVLATGIVITVFVPLFFLPGIEGRLFQSLAMAYVVAIIASLFVALTITPVLAYYLLPRMKFSPRESILVRVLKNVQERNLRYWITRPLYPLAVAAGLFLISVVGLLGIERAFLPKFNEGTLTIEAISAPGTSLSRSIERAQRIEMILKETPGVVSIARRTGRAENDEHAEGVHYSELDVSLDPGITGSAREELLHDLRKRFAEVEGVGVGIGQPISHRLDHMLAGIKSEVAVMIYGHDLRAMQFAAYQARQLLSDVAGVSDVRAETSATAPEFKVAVNHSQAARFGLSVPLIVRSLGDAQGGRIVGRIREGDRFVPVFVRLNQSSRDLTSLESFTLKHLPSGQAVRLNDVADLYESQGPYEIQRENAERRIAIELNSDNRPLDDLTRAIDEKLRAELNLPEGVRFELAGRYASAIQANRRLSMLALAALVMIAFLVYASFRSVAITAQILLTVPFAFIGGVLFLYVFDVSLSVASMVGFIALTGIASRNGILMISHFEHLMREEGAPFCIDTIVRGALERLTPVLMTAGTAALALLPILISGADAPGKELLFPVAIVITGGLISSTALDLMVTPIVYYHIAKRLSLHTRPEVNQ